MDVYGVIGRVTVGFFAFVAAIIVWEILRALLFDDDKSEGIMKPNRERNRVKAFTRWPSDARKRLKRARLDLDFVRAMYRCGIDVDREPELLRIESEASKQAQVALHEIDD